MRRAHIGRSMTSVMLFVALGTNISGQSGQKPKRFLTAPLTIEDQGSFFIGGVPKVTDYATLAPPPPGAAAPAAPAPPLRHKIAIGELSVRWEFPPGKSGGGRVIRARGRSHPAACLESTP